MCMSARKRKSCQLAKQDHNGTDHRQRVSNAEPAGAERLPDISLRAQEHIPFTDQERRQVSFV